LSQNVVCWSGTMTTHARVEPSSHCSSSYWYVSLIVALSGVQPLN
jgi:hypothetical protein